jgi:hypothetical protein
MGTPASTISANELKRSQDSGTSPVERSLAPSDRPHTLEILDVALTCVDLVALRSDHRGTAPMDRFGAASGRALPVAIAPAHEPPTHSPIDPGSVGVVIHGATVRRRSDADLCPEHSIAQ